MPKPANCNFCTFDSQNCEWKHVNCEDVVWSEKVDQPFLNKASEIAGRLGVSINDLMGIFALETGADFSADITNPIGCVGLIQFCSFGLDIFTNNGYDITLDQLKNMTEVEQLDWVETYFNLWDDVNGNAGYDSIEDLYMVVFTPAYADEEDDFVISSEGSSIYDGNSSLDVNNDGNLTKYEIGQSARNWRDNGENHKCD